MQHGIQIKILFRKLFGHGLPAGTQVLPLHAFLVHGAAHFLSLTLKLATLPFQVTHFMVHRFQLTAGFGELVLGFQTHFQLFFQLHLQFRTRLVALIGLLFQQRLALRHHLHLGLQAAQVLAQGVCLGTGPLYFHGQLVGLIAVVARFLAGLVQPQAQLIPAGQQGFALTAVGFHGIQRFRQHRPGFFQVFLFLLQLLVGLVHFPAETLTAHGDLLQAHLPGADLGIDLAQLTVDPARLTLHFFALFFQFGNLLAGAFQLFFETIHGGLERIDLAFQGLQLTAALQNTGFLIFLFGHFQPVRAQPDTITGDHGFVGVQLATQGQGRIQIIGHVHPGQQTFRSLPLNVFTQ